MKFLDWVMLLVWLVSLVSYGLWRGRGSNTVNKYLLAGRNMPWYAMGLSILATQASAITFISTTGQGYVDGMRFVQFYLGLPVAMVILCMTAVPIFHRANVYTAYEYLEKRFDAKTRTLVSGVFLIQRGLGAGIGIYAPAVVLSAVLGVSDRWITILIGALVVIYVTTGGIKALTWADVQQMTMIFCALVLSLMVAIHTLPANISLAGCCASCGCGEPDQHHRHPVQSFQSIQRLERTHWRSIFGAGLLWLRSEPGAALSYRPVYRAEQAEPHLQCHGESSHAVVYSLHRRYRFCGLVICSAAHDFLILWKQLGRKRQRLGHRLNTIMKRPLLNDVTRRITWLAL